MREAFRVVWENPYVRVAAFLLLLAFLLWFFHATWMVWRTALAATVLAAVVHPVQAFLERRGAPRWAAFFVVTLGFLALVALFWVGLLGVLAQLGGFAQELPELMKRALAWLEALWRTFERGAPDWLKPTVTAAPEELGRWLEELLRGGLVRLNAWVAHGFWPAISGLVGGAVELFVGFFLFLYLLWDGDRMLKGLVATTPAAWQPALFDLGAKLEHAVIGYFRGQLAVAGTMGLFVASGLWILGLPMPLATGFLVMVFELIPFLGIALGMLFTALAAAPLGWVGILKALGVFVIAGEFEGHVLAPLILGRATQLHPVTVILVLMAGAELGGLWGAIVAVPLAAFLKLVWLDYLKAQA